MQLKIAKQSLHFSGMYIKSTPILWWIIKIELFLVNKIIGRAKSEHGDIFKMAASLGHIHHFGGINTFPISPRWIGIPKYLYIMNSHGMCYHLMGQPKNGWKISGTFLAHQVKKHMLMLTDWSCQILNFFYFNMSPINRLGTRIGI